MPAVIQPYSTQAYTGIQNSYFTPGRERSDSKQDPAASSSQNNDSLSLSAEGQKLSRTPSSRPATEEQENQADMENKGAAQQALTEEEVREISELKKRDIEVKAHEQAHLAAAGQYAAGGASFSYQTGPDGKRYATGGEVPIDIGKESTPEATIQKMRTVKRAALAPASPSSADRSIAAQATSMEAQAMSELLSNTGKESSPRPLPETNQGTESRGTEVSSTGPTSETQGKNSSAAPLSELTRRTMNAAYQAVADMAA